MAGTLIVSNLTTDTDNTFIVRSNTGTTLFSANTTGIDVANSIGATAITNDKILSVANTKISGNIISSQITSVANTQLTGLIQAAQIGSANATLVTSGTLPTARLPAGSVLQVVQSLFANTTSTSSTSFVTTNHSASITPSSASNKILVTLSGGGWYNSNIINKSLFTTIYRGATNLEPTANAGFEVIYCNAFFAAQHSVVYLDSPATTSATTYTIYFRVESGGTAVYTQFQGTQPGTPVTLTLMEIAG